MATRTSNSDACEAHPRRAVLGQPALCDVEAGENLDARDDRLRQHAGRRRDHAQQAVDAEADGQPGAERLDVDIARAQLVGFFEEIAHRAHHRRAAREVAQALDVVVGDLRRGIGGGRRRGVLFAEALVEDGGDVLERSDGDLDPVSENDSRRAHGGGVARIGDGEKGFPVRAAVGKDRHFAQEATRELLHQRLGREQIGQRDARNVEELRDLVGEVVRRQLGLLPQFLKCALAAGALAQRNLASKMILAAQMVREFVRDVDPHAPPKAAFFGALPPAFEPPNCDFIMIGGGSVAGIWQRPTRPVGTDRCITIRFIEMFTGGGSMSQRHRITAKSGAPGAYFVVRSRASGGAHHLVRHFEPVDARARPPARNSRRHHMNFRDRQDRARRCAAAQFHLSPPHFR